MNEATEVLPRQAPQIKFSESDKERFWSKVKKSDDGCWIWIGGRGAGGYGKFWIDGRDMTAHRAMLLMTCEQEGIDDYRGLLACHHCDNPACVNPKHLYFGTPIQNVMDMVNRGRNAIGEKNGGAVLTEYDVHQIRELYSTKNTTSRKLAKQFHVGKSTILRVLRGKSWKHLNGSSPPPRPKKPDYLTFVEELFRWG